MTMRTAATILLAVGLVLSAVRVGAANDEEFYSFAQLLKDCEPALRGQDPTPGNYFCTGYVIGVADAWNGMEPPILGGDSEVRGIMATIERPGKFCIPKKIEPLDRVTLVLRRLRKASAYPATNASKRADLEVRRAFAELFPCR